MKRPLLLASLLLAMAAPAAAQSDILLRLRSGSPLGDRFRVDSAGSVVAITELGIGITPYSGEGYRMMWDAFHAAFRAGAAESTEWDFNQLGFFSWAGGYNALASGLSSIAFGYSPSATGQYSTALGYYTNATGTGAVALGYRSTADANYAVAIGQRASANGHTGAMVLADGSTTDSLEASANNQFSVRAAGGYRLYSNAATSTGVSINAGGSSWNVISDRNRKDSFLALDPADVLARVRQVPVSTWRYLDEADRTVRHIGPMAQDWHRAFGFSSDSLTINQGDFDGVNLAAIQALDAEVQRLRAENSALREETQARNAALLARIERLEAALADRPQP